MAEPPGHSPTAADYGPEYFTSLYGAEPSQTRIDRWRDRMLRDRALRHCPVPPAEARVLDIGCGYGWLLDAFGGVRERAGSDISAHAIAMARARHPERDYRVADVQQPLPFTGPFHVVLAVNVLEHLADPAAAVAAIAAVCGPGSAIVVHLPTIDNRISGWIYERTYAVDPTHVYRPTNRQLRSLFESRGLRAAEATSLPHTPPWLARRVSIHPSHLAVFTVPTEP